MKHVITCVIATLFAAFTAFSAPNNTLAKHSSAWEFSASNFRPIWLNTYRYPVPSVGSYVSPQGYIGDDCISWDYDPINLPYWSNHINWVNQRALVTAVYQVCSGPGYTRYKAYLSYTPPGQSTKYIHWDGEFLPLY